MTGQSNSRRIVCEFFVAAAVCAGAYFFAVDSAKGRLSAVRKQTSEAQMKEAARAGIGGLTDAQVHDLQRVTLERAEEIKAGSLPATDEATMFARISELASANSVRIDQLNPQTISGSAAPVVLPPGVSSGTPAAAAVEQAASAAKDSRIGYTMSITGGYANLAGFIGAVSRELGYTQIRSVRLSQPDVRNPGVLRAEITSEHHAFDLSAVKVPPLTPSQPAVATPAPAAHAAAHE
jgi:Tfp pilus assembly protein PilO